MADTLAVQLEAFAGFLLCFTAGSVHVKPRPLHFGHERRVERFHRGTVPGATTLDATLLTFGKPRGSCVAVLFSDLGCGGGRINVLLRPRQQCDSLRAA